MSKTTIGIVFILSIPLLALAFPNLGKKSPTYYDIPDKYVAFPAESKFNFEKNDINYPYFYQYGLDMRWFAASLSQGENEKIEGGTALASTSAIGILVYDKKNVRYLGLSNNGKHVYQTQTYLHVSVYVSYQISFFDEKKEYFMDMGNSKLFTNLSPEDYKIIVPNLEME